MSKIKKFEITKETGETTLADNLSVRSLAEIAEGTQEQKFDLNIIDPFEMMPEQLNKPEIKRPGYHTHDDWFQIDGHHLKPGLYYHGLNSKEPPEPIDIWVCSPIHAVAQTCNEFGTSWGLLLNFMNPDGQWREWAMPSNMLKGSGEEMRGELLDMGVKISPDGNKYLHRWLANQKPRPRLTAAFRTGWHRGKTGLSFVFPHQVLGENDVRFQADYIAYHDFSKKGTLAEWKTNVSTLCINNPVLLLAVSTALTGPLLKLVKLQENGGGGIHLMGDSSRGKTTALQVASSVWGSHDFLRTWRATANGLESMAAARNDTLLTMDECGESDPKEIGTIIYALANGLGKQRANRNGGMRQSAQWRVMVLSSGESSISTHMLEGHKRIRAGQEVRLLDIPATNYQYGAFSDLHGREDGRAFSDELKEKTSQYYGTLGIQFIQKLISDQSDLSAQFAEVRQRKEFYAKDGLEARAAGWLVLIGFAGELATKYGLTDWPLGAAIGASIQSLCDWRLSRGEGQTEDKQILQNILEFIQRYTDSRFSKFENHQYDEPLIRDRAGWYRDNGGGREYLFFSASLQEAASGFITRRITDALDRAGWIIEHDIDKRSKKIRVNGTLTIFYCVRPKEEE